MNVLIYGKKASGKTFVAEALRQFYEHHGQHCELLGDDDLSNPLGRYFLGGPKAMTRFLKKTLHNPDKHFILTSQMLPAEMLRPDDRTGKALFDYVYCTERL